MSLWIILIICLDSFKSFIFVVVKQYFMKDKGKDHSVTCIYRQNWGGERQIELQSIRNLGARKGWMVSTRPRPVCLQERKSTLYTGGWLVADLDGHGKSRFTGTVHHFMIGHFYVIRISVFKLRKFHI